MNRFDRIVAILVMLQSKRIVTALEMAERFEVSQRTIYRDIRSLEEAGVPIVSEVGVGYSIMDGYKLPPVMFTKEEALSFVASEKLMHRFTDASLNQHYHAAMTKIKSVLKSADKDLLEKVNAQILVLPNQYLPEKSNVSIGLIMKAITENKVMKISYFANHSQEHSDREIEPVGLFHLGENWHLVAFCKLRKDYRNFRVDRIGHLQMTDLVFNEQHPDLHSFINKFASEKELQEVVLRIDKSAYKYIGDQKYYNGFVSQTFTENHVEMSFLTASIEGMARWVMMLGDVSIILKPDVLKTRVLELAYQITIKQS